MKEQLYLNIPTPCHEDWNQMTPVEQGRHCAVCQKNVVDFTNETDDSIIDFFKNYNGTACGRFTDDQLNRPLSKIELKPASNFLKYATGLLLPALITGVKSSAQSANKKSKELDEIVVTGYRKTVGKVVKANPVAGPIRIDAKDTFTIKPLKPVPIENYLSGRVGGVVIASSYVFDGIITDESTGEPLAGVVIQIKGTNTGTQSRADGQFTLKMDNHSSKLVIMCVGYEKKEINLDNFTGKEINITLKPSVRGEIIVGLLIAKKKYKSADSKLIRRFKDTVTAIFNWEEVKINPNPVSINGTLQLNFGNTKPGLYQIRLLNSSGQLFYSFQKQIASSNETEQIHLNERMSSGIYLLQIMDDKKKLVQTNKVIVQ